MPPDQVHPSASSSRSSNCAHLLGLLLGGLAGLGATGLGLGGVLLGLLRAADGADAGNGLLAQVGAVVVLGGLVGNTLVDPV